MRAKAVIPQNFDLHKHTVTNPPTLYGFSSDNFNIDHALWILSQINQAPAQDKELLDQLNLNGYVHLYSIYLQAKVRNYALYLTYFIKTHVIETDGYFIRDSKQPGSAKSYGYRFVDSYTNCVELKLVGYGQKFTNILKKKVRTSFKELKTDYNHLLKWVYPFSQFTIDYESASAFAGLKRDYFLHYPERKIQIFDKKKEEYVFKDPIKQYRSSITNLLQLQNGTIHFHVDSKGKRLHTNFTNLSKDFRHFITYKGEEFVSFDIKNSQPYLITSLLNKEMYNVNKKININTINSELKEYLPSSLYTLSYLLEKFDNQDVKFYNALVSNVENNPLDLYLYMQQEYRESKIYDFATRKEVKNVMYEVLFTSNKYKTDVKNHFEKLFPTINEVIRHFKKEDKTALPCLLQSIESYLVLQVITKRFARQYKDAPIITIHDSVATIERYADKLKPIMEEELERFTGLSPKVDSEKWEPDHVNWEQYKVESDS